jgi:signal transduction histidine kinase
MCLPLVKQARLVGALYLENRLTSHAFTPSRSALLKVLASQAAISLENAYLYSDLREAQAYLAEAQRLSATGSFGWRPASGEIVWSAETYRIFQLDPATTKPSADLVLACTHPEDRRRVQQFIERTSVEPRDWEIEHRLLMSDGSVKHVRIIARATRGESSGRTEYIGSVMDVTATVQSRRALEKANGEIQAALRARFEAALAERTRIAQELHDTLLQGFAGVTLQLKAAELALPDQPDVAAETLVRVHRLATEALREARESVWDLRGSELDELDLIEALRGRALAATAGSNVAVTVTARGVPRRLPRRIEAAALRVGREALANAVKHADASRIEIDLQFGAALLALQIRDDGRGFTQDQLETAIRNGHFGITSMQDRARQAGGTCEVGPGVQGGTVVTLRLPLG